MPSSGAAARRARPARAAACGRACGRARSPGWRGASARPSCCRRINTLEQLRQRHLRRPARGGRRRPAGGRALACPDHRGAGGAVAGRVQRRRRWRGSKAATAASAATRCAPPCSAPMTGSSPISAWSWAWPARRWRRTRSSSPASPGCWPAPARWRWANGCRSTAARILPAADRHRGRRARAGARGGAGRAGADLSGQGPARGAGESAGPAADRQQEDRARHAGARGARDRPGRARRLGLGGGGHVFPAVRARCDLSGGALFRACRARRR